MKESETAVSCGGRQEALEKLVADRKEELEKYKSDAGSNDPDVILAGIEQLKTLIAEVDREYEAAWQLTENEIRKTYNSRIEKLESEKPEIWETDNDFISRIQKNRSDLINEREDLVLAGKQEMEADRKAQTESFETQLRKLGTKLTGRKWTLSAGDVDLVIGDYDRNSRMWPFTVESKASEIPMLPVTLSADLNSAGDPVAAIKALDNAVRADALTAEVDWKIVPEGDLYWVEVTSVRVVNLVDNSEVVSVVPNQRTAYFYPGKRRKPVSNFSELSVVSRLAEGNPVITIMGGSLSEPVKGRTPFSENFIAGKYLVEAVYPDGSEVSESVELTPGEPERVVLKKIKPAFDSVYLRLPMGVGWNSDSSYMLASLTGIGQVKGFNSVLNPLFLQVDVGMLDHFIGSDDPSGTQEDVIYFNLGLSVGAWFLDSYTTHTPVNLYSLGYGFYNYDKFFDLSLGAGAGVGYSRPLGGYNRFTGLMVIQIGAVGFEVNASYFMPWDGDIKGFWEIEVPLFGFGGGPDFFWFEDL